MKFLGKGFQKFEHRQTDRQTGTQIDSHADRQTGT